MVMEYCEVIGIGLLREIDIKFKSIMDICYKTKRRLLMIVYEIVEMVDMKKDNRIKYDG